MATLASTILYILFVVSAIVLIVVILLQEGRGGGLTDALGTSGQATFGVGASGINRFTFVMIALFLGSALTLHLVNRQASGSSVVNSVLPDTPPPIEGSALPGASAPPPSDAPAPPATTDK